MAKYKIKSVHNVIEIYESPIIDAKDEDEALDKYYSSNCVEELVDSITKTSDVEDIVEITEGSA